MRTRPAGGLAKGPAMYEASLMWRMVSSWLLVVPLIFASCTIVPKIDEKPVATALPVPDGGPLVRTSVSLSQGRTKRDSSFLLLKDAGEALKWRLALIDSARSSIDIQLYLWHGGSSGELLFDRVLRAADRGVRIRILVDDFLLRARPDVLSTLCRSHPNFQFRIFNPGRIRGSSIGSITEMISNFKVLNRRMHNKTFTVDRCMTIVGGRNIGDHYYGMDEAYNFIDLDVLSSGPVVAEVSDGFDAFWNDEASLPGEYLSKKHVPDKMVGVIAEIRQSIRDERDGKLRDFPIERADWRRDLASLKAKMVHGRGRFVQDDPDPDRDDREVISNLVKMTSGRSQELHLATPYLIPSERGMENLGRLNAQGMTTRILVPTLAANNHAVVDGHYRRYRKPLVDGGSLLSEFRGDPTEEVRGLADVAPVRSERVTLHLKAVVADRETCFIGSLNLDPRAIVINTESGIMIESPELSGELADLIDELGNTQNSWRVSRDGQGKMQWQSRGVTRQSPPPAKWTHRLLGWISGLLPIKDQI